ncbi:unnamed protein product [Arabidopsis thaliana]|uniref:Nonsense-mediated mRNA decay-like protein n=4 Tax=Arabidopsis thaliana TaxID=3702 RepID=Q84RJ7_ARATH|nr:nonsense-mediated mRNA decay-like protein [Arabidopsis thaliana]NP_180957.2 nonsense-mediated mRNA decay-like protein [Arabidopsis thaliana]AAO86850.1 hypothetical protein [Arabidopsis thaliana]AEC08919.1 nonsense-mediated mRNA decay-like protein [Arabidopsis thaliana]AEC08920.1 nonsense-mediated mRNA decay-like protein [Arabidopsis thaliana]CAA0374492.1 unnamed protein product [Arabidopsis thaliana]VYS54386.1 unnamed protein product [Arabidopsis thaliana]|eukprot:NP_001154550.1 nonsense-mediated mRNA decay-like protein [Arabidopsis thaliana]
MGGVEGNQWFDKFMDEVGLVFTKVDESIQKSIELWTELTKDIFDDQPNQDLTGQPDNGGSGDEHSSQYPVSEVKERPIQHWYMCLSDVKEKPLQHWSMCIAEVKEKPSQHWAMRASKFPESFTQAQGGDDCYENYGDGADGIDDDDYDEENSESSLKWNCDYQLLKSGYLSFDEEEEEDNDDEEDVDIFSEDSDDSWNEDFDDEDEEADTTVFKYSENMSELDLGSATNYTPSSYDHRNEKDSGSSLTWKGGYQQLYNVDTSSDEEDEESCDEEDDEAGEYHSEEAMEMSREQRMSELRKVLHDDEDDVSQGFVNVRRETIAKNTEFGEVETLLPDGDWVYVKSA